MEVFFSKKIFFYFIFASLLLPLPLLFPDLHDGRYRNVKSLARTCSTCQAQLEASRPFQPSQ